jgi:hypothetical protein
MQAHPHTSVSLSTCDHWSDRHVVNDAAQVVAVVLELLTISGDVRVSQLLRWRENALPMVVRLVVRFSQAPLQGARSACHAIVHTGVHTG